MIYFANPTGDPAVHAAQAAGHIGFIDTPLQKNHRPKGVVWCADNGCFNDVSFRLDRWWAWLEANQDDAGTCVFATAPDRLADAAGTLERSLPWLPKIRGLGYPAAFVAQDGIENVPWDEFDVLFIGGTTEFKLGPVARRYTTDALSRGKWLHMGRVNSYKRIRYAEAIGCHSADGTKLRFGPSINLKLVLDWRRQLLTQPGMFKIGDTA